jgi:hypothetical protein
MTQRLHRDRSLPEGYQFGDARESLLATCRRGRISEIAGLVWRPLHLNAAERLARHAGWNVIEGEQFDSDAERHPVIEGAR